MLIACRVFVLLSLLGADLSKLAVAALLVSLSTSLSVQGPVPPAEARSVVANELLVVHVVVVGTSPDREEMAQAPREVVAAVGVDSLPQTKDDPEVHGDEVKLTGDSKDDNGRSDNAHTEKHSLDRRSVLGCKAERSGIGMVQLVDVLVERSVVQAAMEPVVPGILENEADGDLHSHLPQRRKRNAVVEAEVGGHGVEEPNLRKLSSEVADEDEERAVPLLLESWHLLALDLVLAEVGDLIRDHEGDASAEVDDFVHDEAHDTGSEGVILHEQVPSSPEALSNVEVNIVLGNFFEDGKVVRGLVGSFESREGRVTRRGQKSVYQIDFVERWALGERIPALTLLPSFKLPDV